MKKILFFLIVSLTSYAQPAINLAEDSHDFGTITEGVQASHTFTVENTGTEPLIISNVRPSCGCTTPDWTKIPIKPGGKGYIMATFNSAGRPGAFNKSITVETNVNEPARTLKIKGFVGPKTEKTYSEEELKNSPVASIDRNNFNFGKIATQQTVRQKIRISNTGKSLLRIQGIQTGCHCVEYSVKKTELAPGESTEMELMYKPGNQGEQTDIVTLATNDIVSKDLTVVLKANVSGGFGNGSMMNSGTGPAPFK